MNIYKIPYKSTNLVMLTSKGYHYRDFLVDGKSKKEREEIIHSFFKGNEDAFEIKYLYRIAGVWHDIFLRIYYKELKDE